MSKVSEKARANHIAIWLRLLSEKELRMARSAKQILSLEARKCSQQYRESGSFAAIKTAKSLKVSWHKLIVNYYNWTIPPVVKYTSDQIMGLGIKAPTFLELQQAFVRAQGLLKATQLTDTSVKKLQQVIAYGVKKGKSQQQIADLIKANLTGISDYRARMIARTEVHTAASWAQQATAKHSGRELDREWCAVNDERTRDSHAEADGQVVGMNEPFSVGDAHLDYPGDPDGPPEETINCRCTILYQRKSVFDISDYEYF